MSKRRLRKISDLLLVMSFVLFLFAPLAKMVCSEQLIWSHSEKRLLAERPLLPNSILQLVEFPSQFETYLNDHFGFREHFVRRYQREMKKWFHELAAGLKLIEGRDNWYYYTGMDALKDFCGDFKLTPKKIDGWLEKHNKRKEWLKQKNIQYLVVIAPNKHSIYPEYFTEEVLSVKGKSRFEQLSQHVESSYPNYMVNLHSALLKEKPQGELYYRSDTHWNNQGAYIAFREIAAKLEQLFSDINFKKDFKIDSRLIRDCKGGGEECGDLVNMLLDYEEFSEPVPMVKPFKVCGQPQEFSYPLSNVNWDNPELVPVAKGCPKAKLKAIVFHDSFFAALEPFLSENMYNAIYLWKDYDQQNVEELLEIFQPDIVIVQKVERKLSF